MFAAIDSLITRARRKRWMHLCVINLRIIVGFAFVPAGLKKLLNQPFTDPTNTGVFHEFLHAFYATGPFYQFVGVMQLTAAALLMTQRFSTIGAMLATPIIATICVFCWSTKVYPTAVVVTLILCALIGLLLWDIRKWRSVFTADQVAIRVNHSPEDVDVDSRLWTWCGAAILGFYFAVCAISGGIYRPRGAEYTNPEFYVVPAIAMMPIVALFIGRRRRKAAPPAD